MTDPRVNQILSAHAAGIITLPEALENLKNLLNEMLEESGPDEVLTKLIKCIEEVA